MSLAEKTRTLPPDQAPRVEVDDLVSALEKACSAVAPGVQPTAVHALQAPVRFALTTLTDASRDADAALRGAGAEATGDMPPGWARELWSHAFGRCTWWGSRGAMQAAVESYSGVRMDQARVEAFLAQKQQDFSLGAGDAVDALEWRTMITARQDADMQALAQPGNSGGLHGIAAQLAVDRFLAFAAAHSTDPSFRVSVSMRGPSLQRAMVVRPATTGCAVARMCDPVVLQVESTRDCFFYLLEQDCTGALCPLLPNKEDPRASNKLRGGVSRLVPDPQLGDSFGIEFQPPAGLERVLVFATLEPWEDYAAIARLTDERQRVAAVTRGMRVVALKRPIMAVVELRFTLLE